MHDQADQETPTTQATREVKTKAMANTFAQSKQREKTKQGCTSRFAQAQPAHSVEVSSAFDFALQKIQTTRATHQTAATQPQIQTLHARSLQKMRALKEQRMQSQAMPNAPESLRCQFAGPLQSILTGYYQICNQTKSEKRKALPINALYALRVVVLRAVHERRDRSRKHQL